MNRREGARSRPWLRGALWVLVPLLWACEGPEGPSGPPGPDGPPGAGAAECASCHSPQTTLAVKTLQWGESKHAWGGTSARGTSGSCAGCHASEGFTERIAAGLQPNQVTEGVANPTPIKCRTCHQIHETGTVADWALATEEPVTLMVSGAVFDRGAGNLCASCHQPRAGPPQVGSGTVTVTSGTWGPHRTQASMALGVGGYGAANGPGIHYMAVQDGCVSCHMGPAVNHTKKAQLAACQSCHTGLNTFDRNGVQTQVKAMYAELGDLLVAAEIMASPGGSARPGTYPEAVAGAFWNYKSVYYDRSWGVHNPGYIRTILQESIDALK